MINLYMFQSVRSRLLMLMACVVIPVATLSIILASTTYRSVKHGIETSETRFASEYAVRTRFWFRGLYRSLMVGVTAIRNGAATSEGCSLIAQAVVTQVEGFQAISVQLPNDVACIASRVATVGADDIRAIQAAQQNMPFIQPFDSVTPFHRTRYDSVAIDGRQHLVIHIDERDPDGLPWFATALVDPELLDRAFDVGVSDATAVVALVNRTGGVVVSRGKDERDASWLPLIQKIDDKVQRWQSAGVAGEETFSYASQFVAPPDLFVIARFDNNLLNAAFVQFMVLCITPLLTLALLFGTYVWAIQNDVVRWIKGIESAARARERGENELAPIHDDMPHDIRRVAEGFNAMVTDADKREVTLRQTLDANSYLMRELNHRVKNSLQVIQSYLALSRRQQSQPQLLHMAETEAKVQVLSTAYRLALQDGSMRPVPIQPFAEEILGNLSSSVRGPDQWMDVVVDADAGLVVDRVIPLGLGLVEGVIAGLRAAGARLVRVQIHALPNGGTEMIVFTDGRREPSSPPPKIIAGLAAQIEADVQQPAEGEVLHWVFRPS